MWKSLQRIEEKEKLGFWLPELSLLFLLIVCISRYDNYLYLLKIITLREQPQAGE